jgi:polysaccharide export outer membrane protein
VEQNSPNEPHGRPANSSANSLGQYSLRDGWAVLKRRRWLFFGVVGGLLLLCLVYCLIVPNQYEARARVALRTAPAGVLGMEAAEPMVAASILSAPLQQETLANVFRSDQLAWTVILEKKLYLEPAFRGRFAGKFPDFNPEKPTPAAQQFLLKRFEDRLNVQTVPRTLMIQIRFRSKNAALSAAVVNDLIGAYNRQESDARVQATAQASDWLEGQLKELKARVEQNQQRLADFESGHGLIGSTNADAETQADGQLGLGQRNSILVEIDDLGHQLVAATTDRILREAEYRAAAEGDPERVIAANPQTQSGSGGLAAGMLQQLRSHRIDLEQEQAQLSAEHGPNYGRVVEIRHQLADLDLQIKDEDAKLLERFRSAWQTAVDREQLLRTSLDERTAEAMKLNQAATQFAVMRQEANASHEVYMRVAEKIEEAGMAAGIQTSNITVIDPALEPAKPVAPDLPLYMAITLFVSLWLGVGVVLLVEAIRPASMRSVGVLLLAVLLGGSVLRAQAPTPTTSGIPSGVAHPTTTESQQKLPTPQEMPSIWDNPGAAGQAGVPVQSSGISGTPMPAPLGPGDMLDVSEFHTPEFHSQVHVSPGGTVTLPMVGEVKLEGLDEQGAARAIEAALVAQGYLLHPQVSVLVTLYAGQDVSVLGEVARPGVYPSTLHHRLLDLLSAAAGLSPTAGRLVNVFHRNDPRTAHPVVLDPSGINVTGDHNPELAPGDTVQVSRAGLVYVIGDVVRPGGFPVDPVQGLTVVQALSLAWGPVQNAAGTRALLIREQKGGRTITTLNLKHMMNGEEPDQPIRDRDILFVPDSTAKNLWNKSLESAIQSAVGVTIYAGLVYSQRF